MEWKASPNSYYEYYRPESDRDCQLEFAQDLARIQARRTYPIDPSDLLDQLDHAGLPSKPEGLVDTEGLYLDTSIYDDLSSKNQLPLSCSFDYNPLNALGREDSRHSVFFGNLTLHNYSTRTNAVIPVAVKPYADPEKHHLALHEYAMYEYLEQIDVDAPKQLGILATGQTLYTISEFVPEIITLDSLDWQKLDQATIDDAILRGVETIALLHTHGIFHRDASFKNLTIQPNRLAHWIVDLETSISMRDIVRDVDPVEIVKLAINDLKDVVWSLYAFGIIGDSDSPSAAFQSQYEKVLLPYRRLISETMPNNDIVRIIRAGLSYIDDYFYDLSIPDGDE